MGKLIFLISKFGPKDWNYRNFLFCWLSQRKTLTTQSPVVFGLFCCSIAKLTGCKMNPIIHLDFQRRTRLPLRFQTGIQHLIWALYILLDFQRFTSRSGTDQMRKCQEHWFPWLRLHSSCKSLGNRDRYDTNVYRHHYRYTIRFRLYTAKQLIPCDRSTM